MTLTWVRKHSFWMTGQKQEQYDIKDRSMKCAPYTVAKRTKKHVQNMNWSLFRIKTIRLDKETITKPWRRASTLLVVVSKQTLTQSRTSTHTSVLCGCRREPENPHRTSAVRQNCKEEHYLLHERLASLFILFIYYFYTTVTESPTFQRKLGSAHTG